MTPSEPAVVARFDDLRSGQALQFDAFEGEIVARTPEEVLPALAEVERATSDGMWAYGFVAYEAAAGLDDAFPRRDPPSGLPLVWFGLAQHPGDAGGPDAARLPYRAEPWTLEWSEAEHAERVGTVRRAIADGETYQCNLTTRMTSTVTGDLFTFYRDLAARQRGGYNAFLDLGRWVIASASPECFFEWSGGTLASVPMKGTAPRGLSTAADVEARRLLRASGKDRAENVMIVDLIRNDLARVADPDSVRVTDLMAVERYPTVWQLTSTVSGETPPDTTVPDIFRAMFPCGSVTGAPKIRTMELIDELETSPRGVYCGAIGYVAPVGSPTRARFNVAIRTVVVDRSDDSAVYGVGGGITWGSAADDEYREIRAKSRVLDPSGEAVFGLIETFAVTPDGPVNLDRHLDRLQTSAEYFHFRLDRSAVLDRVRAVTGPVPSTCLVRVELARDGTADVRTRDLPPDDGTPVGVVIDTTPVEVSRFVYHKTTIRDAYTDARRRHPAADDVLLVNADGRVTESTIANLAARIDGTWFTPPVEDGCLPGVGRQLLLERGALAERSLSVEDVRTAEELALVSSARGWRPARVMA
ncbi:aminodeoxychorismate synthase component I [Georgenia halophila]|uniref:Aminodeoxychorismate synthase component I n=1 Tax=Georgenia halophila TaxID=620889 RepID=A0ABP8LLT7_9MICO